MKKKKMMMTILAAGLAAAIVSAPQVQAESLGPVYDRILEMDYITADDAYRELADCDTLTDAEKEWMENLADLLKCSGLYVDRGNSGDVYTAQITVYLKNGETYCSIDYTGYSGTLDDALIEPIGSEEEGNTEETYQFVSHPLGHFYSTEHDFTVELGAEEMHVQWADTCAYTLTKATGSADELAETKFADSEEFKTIADILDESFVKMDHHYTYDESTKTMYVYVVVTEGGRDTFIRNAESLKEEWNTLVESFREISEKVGTYIDIAARDGLSDFTKGHCCLMIVDSLNEENRYFAQDTWAVFEDGEVQYDLMEDLNNANGGSSRKTEGNVSSSGNSSASGSYGTSASATSGERNALQRAKEYLDYIAFSYTGLIEQLEYEGYSHSEAVYGADHCGADWKEQAVQKARDYLEYMSFSYSGLVDQLEYEGFTHEEAVYGADIAY